LTQGYNQTIVIHSYPFSHQTGFRTLYAQA